MSWCPFQLYGILWGVGGRKNYPGEVADDLLSWGTLMLVGFQVDKDVDWYGVDSGRRRVFFLVGYDLASQAKAEFDHPVFPWVVGPHGCKDLANWP